MDKFVSMLVYCNHCGYDWVACYGYFETTRLECPSCHKMSRINEIREVKQ